jgi:hypothetical protein
MMQQDECSARIKHVSPSALRPLTVQIQPGCGHGFYDMCQGEWQCDVMPTPTSGWRLHQSPLGLTRLAARVSSPRTSRPGH